MIFPEISSGGTPTAAPTATRRSNSASPSNEAVHATTRRRADHPSWKRTLDITCICLAVPALAIVVVFIALMIKAVSPGPIFYRQERVGYRRTRFMCWKFRSMTVNAEATAGLRHDLGYSPGADPMARGNSARDSRLIPCGALLRASGLVDLPQLINVWRGEMSLVGPRPCTPYEFESCQPRQLARFEALPGLTGLWQVSGKNRTTFDEMVALDIRYVQRRSLRLDLDIMVKTVGTVAHQVARVSRRATAPDAVPAA